MSKENIRVEFSRRRGERERGNQSLLPSSTSHPQTYKYAHHSIQQKPCPISPHMPHMKKYKQKGGGNVRCAAGANSSSGGNH
uniref:Uncharacterized protein n=1 Tax=Arundo donax TaxID=35708 RepID=A0A0A9GY45_ARUDO